MVRLDLLEGLDAATAVISNSAGDAPLLNEYKRSFVARQVLSTFFGGVKVVRGEGVWKLHLLQSLLFLFPAIILVIGLVLGINVSVVVGSCVAAVVGCICTLSLLLIRRGMDANNVAFGAMETDDEGRVDVPYPLFSKQTFAFLVAGELGLVACCTRAVVSGLLFAAATVALSHFHPTHRGVNVVVAVFSIFSVCIAHFSTLATHVPEPIPFANAGTLLYHVDTVSRPLLGALLFLLGDVLQHFFSSTNASIRLSFLVAVCALPIMWLFALAPPLSALVLYLLQQLNVLAYGGSTSRHYAALLRSVVAGSVMWGALVLIWSQIRNSSVSIVSLVLCSLYAITFSSKHPGNILNSVFIKPRVHPLGTTSRSRKEHEGALASVGFTLLLLAVTLGSSLVTTHAILPSSTQHIFGSESAVLFFGVMCTLLVVHTLFSVLQQTYPEGRLSKSFPFITAILFLCSRSRNPFHRTTQAWMGGSIAKWMQVALRHIMVIFALSAIVGFSSFGDPASASHTTIATHSLLLLRAIRGCLQRPVQSMLELSLVLLILLVVQAHSSSFIVMAATTYEYSSNLSSPWVRLPFLQQLFAVSFLLTRAHGFVLRAKFVLVTTISTFSAKENKLSFAPQLGVFLILYAPITIATVLLSSLLDTPLVPLFCLPVFVASYPRPKMLWPKDTASKCNTEGDGVYYSAALPEIESLLQKMRESNIVGEMFEGQSFLLRFENRILATTICETGFDYAAFEIKGLELVETSCHTVEASHVEEVIERSWPYKPWKQKVKPTMATGASLAHHHQFAANKQHARKTNWGIRKQGWEGFTPVTQTFITTYTDTSSALTGIVDLPYMGGILYQCMEYALCFVVSSMDSDKGPLYLSRKGGDRGKLGSLHDAATVKRILGKLGNSKEEPTLSNESVVQIIDRSSSSDDDKSDGWGDDDIDTMQIVSTAQSDDWRETCVLEVLSSFFHDKPPVPVYVGLMSNFGQSFVFSELNHQHLQQIQAYFDSQDEDIKDLVRKASGYALKLAIDFVTVSFGEECLGDDDEEEILESLRDFEENWYMGSDEGKEWFDAVLQRKKALFSITKSDNEGYRTHLVTTQAVPIYIVELNHQTMHGLWLNVAWELLYLTNDDEERYSIQAHKQLLRNLTTQIADPPLGYPVFSHTTLL
eukprot:m.89021 g.89021  ORF g.89021 m.89021 type:complete len:1158 (+) comp8823_c0_seq1:11-3484(+)